MAESQELGLKSYQDALEYGQQLYQVLETRQIVSCNRLFATLASTNHPGQSTKPAQKSNADPISFLAALNSGSSLPSTVLDKIGKPFANISHQSQTSDSVSLCASASTLIKIYVKDLKLSDPVPGFSLAQIHSSNLKLLVLYSQVLELLDLDSSERRFHTSYAQFHDSVHTLLLCHTTTLQLMQPNLPKIPSGTISYLHRAPSPSKFSETQPNLPSHINYSQIKSLGIAFDQQGSLESSYQLNKCPSNNEKSAMSVKLGLNYYQVQKWFEKQRCKERRVARQIRDGQYQTPTWTHPTIGHLSTDDYPNAMQKY